MTRSPTTWPGASLAFILLMPITICAGRAAAAVVPEDQGVAPVCSRVREPWRAGSWTDHLAGSSPKHHVPPRTRRELLGSGPTPPPTSAVPHGLDLREEVCRDLNTTYCKEWNTWKTECLEWAHADWLVGVRICSDGN